MKKQNKKSASLRGVNPDLIGRIRQSNPMRSPRFARDDESNFSPSDSPSGGESKGNSFDRVYAIVRNIPKGKVMTYGQVAILANVATPRVVGFALHVNRDPKNIPCHRVVFSNGTLTTGYAFGGERAQREKLQSEGITFTNKGEVLLEKHIVSH